MVVRTVNMTKVAVKVAAKNAACSKMDVRTAVEIYGCMGGCGEACELGCEDGCELGCKLGISDGYKFVKEKKEQCMQMQSAGCNVNMVCATLNRFYCGDPRPAPPYK